ncbi:MAG: aldehyde dehydrogenase family protein, partial [Phycisphaerae bacterium]|nr:aldehyde dehydrogenase family protein [Phycisphaerae bacterium]
GVITALEMGGNNPLIVHGVSDVTAAAYATIQSAFITAGQRCSCARRLIVPEGNQAFIDRLIEMMKTVRVGMPESEPEPLCGPVINAEAAERLLAAQSDLLRRNGRMLVEMRSLVPLNLLSPGLIDVTDVCDRADEELFGPLLQLIRVRDFDAAIEEANATAYGLAAGFLGDDRAMFERFFPTSRAGVVNWNRPLTGASSRLPFGGVGHSGNGRPSAYFAADYCDYPIAVMETAFLDLPVKQLPGISI